MKMLIISACLVNYGDDRGGVDEPQAAIVDVNKDTATKLADNERALYVDARDDHTGKAARYTADARVLKAAEKERAARAAAAAPAPAPAP